MLLFAKGDDPTKLIDKKTDFIIEIASSISHPELANSDTYRMGVFGKGQEILALCDALETRTKEISINGKSVEFLHFKKTKNLEPVNILFISGKSKVRLGDINEKLGDYPYIIITENFPYGTSALNFAFDKNEEIMFEVSEESLVENGLVLDSQLFNLPNRILSKSQWEEKLAGAMEIIQDQEERIDVQEDTIEAQDKVIKYQRIALAIGILSIMIITALIILNIRSNKSRKSYYEEIVESISYAEYIQGAILPSNKIIKEHFPDSFVLYKPKYIVSGDFYWIEDQDNKIFFSAADCTGHGVPGALLTMMCSNSLTRAVKELDIYEPAKILDKTVEIIQTGFEKSEKDMNDGMDLALCSFDKSNLVLEFAGANNSLYYIRDGLLNIVKPDRQPIGKFEKRKPYTNHKIQMQKGDCIYLFSDGFTDQFGGSRDKKFSTKQFREVLIRIYKKPMSEQLSILEQSFENWKGRQEQIDDICVMGIRIQ